MATMVGTQKDLADLLNSLLALDYDAIDAYEAAIDRIDDDGDKAQLEEFKGDHERHVCALHPLVVELGEKPVEKADIKRVLTKGKVVLASLVGDRMILLAMKMNEDDTNLAYDRAVQRADLPAHIHEVLVQNRDDERRHLAYILGRLEDYEVGEKESAVTSTPAIEPPPTSQSAPSTR
ncbi:MAG: DUF2383 domain-containing protein [Labilithrix sp.]|nr:DUF2383 domain-containing protein [Labilithrix sp.]MCW5837847.1 DUF2383 domain-containing protein [Labilithrix sp.]